MLGRTNSINVVEYFLPEDEREVFFCLLNSEQYMTANEIAHVIGKDEEKTFEIAQSLLRKWFIKFRINKHGKFEYAFKRDLIEALLETPFDNSSKPKVFISYSYDSEEHKEWVEFFAKFIGFNGIKVIFDEWSMRPGDNIPDFMTESVEKSDHIICICSTEYNDKANKHIKGAGYEADHIIQKIIEYGTEANIIPVLRNNEYNMPPKFLKSKNYIDMSDDAAFFENCQKIIDVIKDKYAESKRNTNSLGQEGDFSIR